MRDSATPNRGNPLGRLRDFCESRTCNESALIRFWVIDSFCNLDSRDLDCFGDKSPRNDGLFVYRLGCPSCLAGDIIGDYEFEKPLAIGDKIIIKDMIHYTIVKNNLFNGIPLPSLAILKKNGKLKIVRKFDYNDYKKRNG